MAAEWERPSAGARHNDAEDDAVSERDLSTRGLVAPTDTEVQGLTGMLALFCATADSRAVVSVVTNNAPAAPRCYMNFHLHETI